MTEFRTVTEKLRFPEGPVAMPDGSVLVVEIAGKALTWVKADGSHQVIAELGGGPNGAAIGPDGKCYICNSGGWNYTTDGNLQIPAGNAPDNGWIERVDLDTGVVEKLYSGTDEVPLRSPNDIVFDAGGGFWFTDHGKRIERQIDRTGIFYARGDRDEIREVIFPMLTPNGIALDPARAPVGLRHYWPRRGRQRLLTGAARRAAGCGTRRHEPAGFTGRGQCR